VAPGSTVTIVAEAAEVEGQLDAASLSHLGIEMREGDTTDRATHDLHARRGKISHERNPS